MGSAHSRKRISSAAAAGLAACVLLAGCGQAVPPKGAAVPPPARATAAGPGVHTHVERLHSASPPYVATLDVPVVVWVGHAQVAARVNAAMGSWVDGRVAAFTAGVRRDLAGARNLPKSLPESSLTLTFHAVRVDARVASFSFREEPYFAGEASPAQLPFGLTFNLATGRTYALADLFRGGADYLGTLSHAATAGLASFHPAGAHCTIGHGGPSPAPANFSAWWLSPYGVVLSFPAGRYTAAYCGPPTVIVPSKQLAPLANPAGPLASSKG